MDKMCPRPRARGIRTIRDFDITETELNLLIEGGHKLDGTTINAITAKVQADLEAQGESPHWCVFSSWLGPLVEGKVREIKGGTGFIEQHITAAAAGRAKDLLTARTIWIIPLCSLKRPYHWVLSWIDFGRKKICFFDSIPESMSTSWAEPIFLRIIDNIFISIGRPLIDWAEERSWKRERFHPDTLQCQMDNWSCGIFVLMAFRALTEGKIISQEVGCSKVEEGRTWAIQTILSIPISRPEIYAGAADPKQSISAPLNDENSVETVQNPITINPPSTLSHSTTVLTSPLESELSNISPSNTISNNTGLKRSASMSSLYSADNLSDNEKNTVNKSESHSKKRPRTGPLQTPEQRRQALIADKYTVSDSVKEDSVSCNACKKSYKLSNRKDRPYELRNWEAHKKSCSMIAGVEKLRIARVVRPKSRSKGPIDRFFVSKLSSSKEPESTPVSSISKTASGPSQKVANMKIKSNTKTVYYDIKVVNKPSITSHFASAPSIQENIQTQTSDVPVRTAIELQLCKHLSGPQYLPYIRLIRTREIGGVSVEFVARLARQLFPYKPFEPLKSSTPLQSVKIPPFAGPSSKSEIPDGGNRKISMRDWTTQEYSTLYEIAVRHSRWKVDFSNEYIKSTLCHVTTANSSQVCDECMALSTDESLKRSIRRKNYEASQSEDDRREILVNRVKFSGNNIVHSLEKNKLSRMLKDPVVFSVYDAVQTGNPHDCFLRLYQLAQEGKLSKYGHFQDICEALTDRVVRETSSPNAKYGIRYSQNYLNFMILMRGYGHMSNRQYGFLSAELGGPSVRHLRTLVTKSSDALSNPALVFENVARVRRYVDSMKYSGPIVVAGDNTRVCPRLNFSTEHGAHILGSVLDMADTEVEDAEDIEIIVDRVVKGKKYARQVRAILAKIPLPRCPPIVIALLPTDGTETAQDIHVYHLKIQKMAAQLSLPLIAFTADGASSELAAQELMDKTESEQPPLKYEFKQHGINFKIQAPVFKKTGPLISVTDAPHARKTCRNQPQYGTHTASLGTGFLVNRSLVDLYLTNEAGLVIRDVENVDKQDDGAARRVHHALALKACTVETTPGVITIRPGFEGLFAYLFVLGSLFEAWMNPVMNIHDRVVSALRARFWLHYWRKHIVNLSKEFPDLYSLGRSFISPASFHILNRLCDTLVLLALAYSEYYPTIAFCPWQIDTSFVEHFFGIARQLLPNFSYAEFLKMAQHIMVRQRILESGLIKSTQERSSAVGYSYSYDPHTDMHSSKQNTKTTLVSCTLTRKDLDQLVKQAHNEAQSIHRNILHIPSPTPDLQKGIIVVLEPLGSAASRSLKKSKAAKLAAVAEHAVENKADSDTSDYESDDGDELDTTDDELFSNINDATSVAASDIARYSAICKDLDDAVRSHDTLASDKCDRALPMPHYIEGVDLTPPPSSKITKSSATSSHGTLINPVTNCVSVKRMVQAREQIQSGTGTKSERTVAVSIKYTSLENVLQTEKTTTQESGTIKQQEASHRLRVLQDTNTIIKNSEQKKTRQLRWQYVAKHLDDNFHEITKDIPYLSERGVTALNELKRGVFIIMKSTKRYYIGEVLDIYKRGQNSRYGSIERHSTLTGLSFLSLRVYLPLEIRSSPDEDFMDGHDSDDDDADASIPVPDFTCIPHPPRRKYHLHTHARVSDVIYNLGSRALHGDYYSKKTLSPQGAFLWRKFARSDIQKAIGKANESLLKIRIPGRKTL